MNDSPYLTPKQRRMRNREEMIAAIAQTARDIMREDGVAALNLNEIARRLGMRTPSLYEYFPNKMALYDHLFRVGIRLFTDHMEQTAAEPAPSPWDHLERVLAAYFQCAVDNPDLFKLVFERHVPGFVPSGESMAESFASLNELGHYLQSFLHAAQIDTPLTIEQMRDVFIVLLHGMTALHLANNPDQPVGQGRFGSLIPLLMEMLKKAWGNETA